MNDQPHRTGDSATPETTPAHRIPQLMQQAQQYLDAGGLAAAEALYHDILSTRPQHAGALNGLGIVCQQQGRFHEAVDYFQRSLARRPEFAGGHCNLGATLYALGRLDDAAACFDRALALQPELAEAHNRLGMVRRGQGRLEEALECYRRAVALAPDLAEAHNNLGNALRELEQVQEAIRHYQRALTVKPDFAEAHNNLGFALYLQHRLDEAIAHYTRAIELNPRYAQAHNNLATALHDRGRLGEDDEGMRIALPHFRRALELQPDFAETYSNLLFALNYSTRTSPEMLFEEARRFAERHEAPLAARREPHANDPDPQRRLRVGYVSGDFRAHSVAFFIEPLFAHYDRTRFEVFCYSCYAVEDDVTQRLKRHADHWRSLMGLSDEVAAQLIRADGIDILVDLAGHTAENRLLVFAHKPAPVQVTWLGYLNTTGLSTMDYRLSDSYASPPGVMDTYHTEELVRLPNSQWCYQPPHACPEVGDLPALESGGLTFASLHNIAKISLPVLRLWAEVLAAVPGSRLILAGGGLEQKQKAETWSAHFAQRGIDIGRLEFLGVQPFDRYLALHQRVDVNLDAFPYPGGTTTCHSLWMGVPVITLAGQTVISRSGVSLLSTVGLSDFIAHTPEEYVGIAVKLAADIEGLRALRVGLRERMAASPLCDAAAFARDVEAAYRTMWRSWCVRQGR